MREENKLQKLLQVFKRFFRVLFILINSVTFYQHPVITVSKISRKNCMKLCRKCHCDCHNLTQWDCKLLNSTLVYIIWDILFTTSAHSLCQLGLNLDLNSIGSDYSSQQPKELLSNRSFPYYFLFHQPPYHQHLYQYSRSYEKFQSYD